MPYILVTSEDVDENIAVEKTFLPRHILKI